ncbi:hypothetical protein GL263_26550, partial [Streptomyces durbertensis]|nr:hypothetical protein [Streptomyces durbertensis]
LAGLSAVAAGAAFGCARLLAPDPARRPTRLARPTGRTRSAAAARGGWRLLPPSPLGAVVGRELRQWWRDPWRSLELQCAVWTVVFIGLIGVVSGVPVLLPFGGALLGLFTGLVACNLLGQDGTALWLTVVGAGPGTVRDDVRGRQIALLLMFAPAAVALTVVMTVVSGEHWTWPVVATLLPALLGAGVGMAVLLSVVAGTPGVDPKYRVGPNDAGDVSYQLWISIYGTLLAALPAVLLAAALVPGLLAGTVGAAAWLAVPFGVANGGTAAWLLGRVAHRRLAARLPETFVRLRYGRAVAAEQQPAGDGWLDRMERGAIAGNQERRPVGS